MLEQEIYMQSDLFSHIGENDNTRIHNNNYRVHANKMQDLISTRKFVL